ncbi:MAG: lasso peptide biosynthesis B2 protein [Bacteroidales bacterium]|nr:lasso peptide biosynthesis B2 protein [Bacteroidales bacterium]
MIQLLSFKTYSNWQNSKKTGKHIDIVILQKAVKKIERHAFWPNTCFSIALAVKIYLNQQQVASQIVFGLKKEAEGELKAHAWLKIDDNIISGNYRIDEYTEMYRFE